VKNYALFLVRRRWYVLAAWVLLLILMSVISRAAGGADYRDVFKLPGTETQTVSDLLKKAHLNNQNGIDGLVVLKSNNGNLSATQPPADFTKYAEALCKPSYKVLDVLSPWGEVVCQNGKATLKPAGAAPYLLSAKDPSVAIVRVSFNGDKFDQHAVNRTYKYLKGLNGSALSVQFTGNAFNSVDQQQQGGVSPELFGFMAALIILSIVFRTFGTVAIPLLSAVCALNLGSDLIALLTHVMDVSNVTPQLATLMVIGVGIDYALFIVTRHRRNLQHGMSVEESIAVAVNTSGRAVMFAGITVCIAMMGLIALGVNFFYGMAIGVTIAVSMTMLASLTLLPAVLGFLGHRALPRSQREALDSDKRVKLLLCVIPPVCVVFWVLYGVQFLIRPWTSKRAARRTDRKRVSRWYQWSEFVADHKAIVGTVAAGVIVILAIPFFSLRMGHADQNTDPKKTTTYKGYHEISQAFGQGFNSAITLVVDGPNAAATAQKAAEVMRTTPNVDAASVFVPPAPSQNIAFVTLKTETSPQDVKTDRLVVDLRKDVLPKVYASTGDKIYVYGESAIYRDFSHVLSQKMPLFIGAVVLLSFLLLMLAFRSILIPLTAALMNLFAASASFGVIVAIFQWGWLSDLLGVGGPGPIEAFAPVLFFAVLFGLSMDYQVFLVSRMHEEWVHTHNNRRAVTVGQAETGGIITAAAIIMISVFGGFILGDNRVVKLIGIGLASAIFIDAFILRTVLVPAIMHVLGKWNWWYPRWADKITPHLSIESKKDDDWSDVLAERDRAGEEEVVGSSA
jgi:RND superfamily putative drug exporter